ncbi:hypothetical protein JHK87_020485 [Glycine soja]|nr:hypothetical protein JHK87_020485 [Glycine soja]
MCGSMRVMNTKVEEKEGESVVRSDLDSQCIRGCARERRWRNEGRRRRPRVNLKRGKEKVIKKKRNQILFQCNIFWIDP